jgi:hypothetical protein
MPVPAPVNTSNMDVGTDNPQTARADLLDLAEKFNTLLTHLAATTAGVSADDAALSITSTVNVSSAVAFSSQHIRIGEHVHASFGVEVTVAAAGSVFFSGSLPVASNFTTPGDGGGSGVASGSGGTVPVQLSAISSDVMRYFFSAPAAGVYTLTGTYMYRVQ